ncbi:MAG: glycosyltransferase family 4 protein [Candidatus Methylomirabilales bacterium]
MRIDILFYTYEPGLSEMGGLRKVLGLAGGLQGVGTTVRVVAPRFLNLEDPRLEVVTYPTLPVRLLRPLSACLAMAWIAWRRWRRVPPNLVYARTNRNVLPGLLARWLRTRFIFEVNGDAFGEQGWRGGILRALTILAADWINCRLAHRVLAITPGLKSMVERRYRVAPANVCLIPSGTDTALIRPLDHGECRRALGLAPVGAVVVFLGVLYHHQGVETLLGAAPEIVRQHPGTRILIVGDGPARPSLDAHAQALGLSASVAFVGQVPYERVPLYLGAADCCVAPFTAQRGETSPLKLFDYMAAGRAVVASEIPAIANLIKDSGAIVAVPPNDPRLLAEELAALLADPRRRELLGEAGRRYVEAEHSWEHLAHVFLEAVRLRDQ